MAVESVNVENFEEKVIKSDKPVLVDFWAGGVGVSSACQSLKKSMAKLLVKLKLLR